MSAERFVKASDLADAERKLRAAEERVRKLTEERTAIEVIARERAEDALRAELVKRYARIEGENVGPYTGQALAHITLPDNGGVVQVSLSDQRPGEILLRIWGPPDENELFGVYEQGGGNITDFSMLFCLTATGIEVGHMDLNGRDRK